MWKYTEHQINNLIKLRKEHPELTINDLVKITGINKAKIKRTFLGNQDLQLTSEQMQNNAYKAKLAKNPNAMAEMRKSLTPEIIELRKGKILEAYTTRTDLAPKASERMIKWFNKNPKKSKYIWEDILNAAKEVGMDVLSEPIKVGFCPKINMKCHCGNLFDTGIYDLLYGKVNSCGCVKSVQPVIINKFLNENNILTKFNDWGQLGKFELDIFCQEKQIAIEYCGLHWHSDRYNKENDKHYNKMLLCKSKGIRLLTIFSDEWLLRQKQVIGYLRSIFNINIIRIGARECVLEKSSIREIREFVDQNHLQTSSGNICYSLKYNNELIAAMIFRKTNNKRMGKPEEGVWELTRFCNKIGFSTTGGFQKLLAAFKNDYNPIKIISYSDNRWSQGGLYLNNGFKNESEGPPDYWYVRKSNDKLRYHKGLFRKDKIAKKLGINKESFTESEIMEKYKYFKIWDCGKIRWVLDFPQSML